VRERKSALPIRRKTASYYCITHSECAVLCKLTRSLGSGACDLHANTRSGRRVGLKKCLLRRQLAPFGHDQTCSLSSVCTSDGQMKFQECKKRKLGARSFCGRPPSLRCLIARPSTRQEKDESFGLRRQG